MKKLVFYLGIVLIIASCKDNVIGNFDPIEEPDQSDVSTISKKGVAFTNRAEDWSHKTSDLKAYWMYSWGNNLREEIPENVEFVPMFWGKGSVTDDNINRIKGLVDEGKVKYILGFNEPDGAAQANMTVDEAIELWPRLEEIGVPIGSPATVSPNNDWMTEFMQRADEKGLRVDFITVHHYGGTSVSNFINKLGNTYRAYGERPIWITEFAVADWNATSKSDNRFSVSEVKDFMAQVLPALDEIEWVEKYSWFSGTNPPLATSALFTDESEMTELGKFYAEHTPNTDIGPGQDTDFEPEVDPDEVVLNPGFETGQLSPWAGFKNGLLQAGGSISVYEGNFSGRIENGDGSLFQVIEVVPGETYAMEYHSKWRDSVTDSMNPTLRNNANNDKLFDITNPPLTTEWEKSTFEFTVPDGVTEIKMVFYKPNGFPPFYLDNVSIKVKE